MGLHCRTCYLRYVYRLIGCSLQNITHCPNRRIINPGSLVGPLPPVSALWHIAICDDKARRKYPNTFKQTSDFLLSKNVYAKEF